MDKIAIALLLVVLVNCNACSHKEKELYKGFLDRDYDLVIAHAVPDEDRTLPTEVFVGRLVRVVPDSSNGANLEDWLMYVQLNNFQQEYYALLEYHDDAVVTISSGGKGVHFTSVGKGTYRDVNNELHLEALGTCTLSVTRPGGISYSAVSRIPGNIDITNISTGDTIVVYPKKETSSMCGDYSKSVSGPEVQGVYFYRFEMIYNGSPFRYLHSTNTSGIPVIVNECGETEYADISWTSMAFDSVLTRAWGLPELTGFEPGMLDSLNFWKYTAPITYRSNITDENGDKIAGYFGAYNSVKTHFVMKALKDSCTCD